MKRRALSKNTRHRVQRAGSEVFMLEGAGELEKSRTEKNNISVAKLGLGTPGTRGNVGATSFMVRGLQGVGEEYECDGLTRLGELKRNLSRGNFVWIGRHSRKISLWGEENNNNKKKQLIQMSGSQGSRGGERCA